MPSGAARNPTDVPVRVIHVITRLIVGGAQENPLATVLGLREDPEFQATLIAGPTTGPEGSLEPEVAGVPGLLVRLPALVRPIHPWLDVRAWAALTAHFREQKPQLVHTHSGKAGILGRLAARRAGVPWVVHTIHGPSFGPFQNAFTNRILRAAERRAGRVTHAFVVVADAMTRQYLAAGIGRPDQYTRVFSGFDLGPFLRAATNPCLRPQLGFAPGDVVVGKVARLFALKGHDDLFAAAPELVRRCPSMRFLLVGDGPWRGRFERQARAAGLADRFVFAGLIEPVRVADYFGAMDILVHLSRREGLPRALPQALAAAKPVVACDCDGANEVCLDGRTGYLLPAGDRPSLVDRLLRLATDPPLRERLGRAGQDFVRERFSTRRMVEDTAALYRRLTCVSYHSR
jgi:glycosyltransferase involved in cell wall biosynthesis